MRTGNAETLLQPRPIQAAPATRQRKCRSSRQVPSPLGTLQPPKPVQPVFVEESPANRIRSKRRVRCDAQPSASVIRSTPEAVRRPQGKLWPSKDNRRGRCGRECKPPVSAARLLRGDRRARSASRAASGIDHARQRMPPATTPSGRTLGREGNEPSRIDRPMSMTGMLEICAERWHHGRRDRPCPKMTSQAFNASRHRRTQCAVG